MARRAKEDQGEDERVEVIPGYSFEELMAVLPKMDPTVFQRMSLEEGVEANRSAVVAQLFARAQAGDQKCFLLVANICLEPLKAKVKMLALSNAKGDKGNLISGPHAAVKQIMDDFLTHGGVLPVRRRSQEVHAEPEG